MSKPETPEVVGVQIRHPDQRKGDWYPAVLSKVPDRLGGYWEFREVYGGEIQSVSELEEDKSGN